ncbi:hypothetical protein QJS04_geneDACA001069 [Acorus gramineus]|uniref:H15 domain-containing protein n=1 Tax=Acorus gramineus TaxID=55184 RepID=A0AAV9AC98_ACOGR|nr:hypothetical protein QJS04_geneDACA001069 [Acorus gramineus]
MSGTVEATMEAVPPPQTAVEKKVSKAKKPAASKAAAAAAQSHPPYFQMIKEALLALHEKSGSSPYAIAKHMEENHKGALPENYKKMLGLQLKNFTAKGKLVKVKASFKLSEAGKKESKSSEKKVVKKKKIAEVSTKSAGAPKKASEVKKPMKKKAVGGGGAAAKKKKRVVKKATPVKAKQPKSIKSPSKKARKAA